MSNQGTYEPTRNPDGSIRSPDTIKIITVRLRRETHIRLKEAAHDERTSLNRFCVEALDAALEKSEKGEESL